MANTHPTPEQVIADMSNAELREFLFDLKIDSTAANVKRLRHLTQALGCLESAIEVMAGPAVMAKAA